MDNKLITSLCYVYNKNDKTSLLCRIADYINDTFIPYTYDQNRDFYGEERDLLYGQNYEVLAEQGEIGIFDWYAYLNSDNQWRTYVKRNNTVPWFEVLTLNKYDSPVRIAAEIKNGLALSTVYDGKHDLVLVSKTDSMGLNAVYLKAGTVRLKDNYLVYGEDVIKVVVGTLDVRNTTGSCQCRYLQTDQKFLRYAGAFNPKKQYNVKKPVEVVRDILQGNINYFDSGVLSRKEKQLLRGVVARVTEPTIVDMVCDKLKCTVQEAHEYINQYIESANLKLEKQKAISIIEKLIESDVDAVMEMKGAVKEEWLQENQELVQEKNKEIQKYNDELKSVKEAVETEKARVQQAVQAEEGKLKRTTQENIELTESVNKLKTLKEELEKEIQERIANARTNLAGSLLDQALMMPVVQPQQTVVSEVKAPKAFSVSYKGEETEKAEIYDCHDVAVNDWNRVCGDEDMSAGLALVALAAFACNRSVLVAGEGAETIADMLSVTVCGHMPLKIRIQENADLEALFTEVEEQDHQSICVINGIESGYTVTRELMEHFRDSRFIVTAMHAESLAMEPESLFVTFFPVLTEYFYNGRHVKELSTLDCSEELLKLEGSEEEKQAYRQAKKNVGKWLMGEFFPPLFRVRCAKLIASMIWLSKALDLGESVLHTAELELVLTPWLKCFRRKETLLRILEEDGALDSVKKDELIKYINADGM